MSTAEDGVSEAIGGVLLIALVLVGAAIVGAYVASQPLPEKVPKVEFNVKGNEDPSLLFLEHAGGETLNKGTFTVMVNGEPVPEDHLFFPDNYRWSLGDRLRITHLTDLPESVGLVYTDGSGDTLLRSVTSSESFYDEMPPSGFDPYEVVDVPEWLPDGGTLPAPSYPWPSGYDPQPTFTPAPGGKHVYVAAVDSDAAAYSIIPTTDPKPQLFVCDGTSDQAEINDAIEAAQGGIVELLEGHFYCSGRITLRDHTTLLGQGCREGTTGHETVIQTKALGGSTYLPIAVSAEYVNLKGFTLCGNGFVMVTRSHVRVQEVFATSVDLDGKWQPASGNGMFFVWVAPPVTVVDDVEFYKCTAYQCHTHGFNMNQDYNDRVPRATTNIRFVQCRAALCGQGMAGDPGYTDEIGESRSEWITGFDFHEWQDLVNLEVVNCVAEANWESGFHLEPGARYTEPPGPMTVSENIVFRDCLSANNGRSTYANHFFMSGYYLSRDTHLENCVSRNNRNCGYYVHGGKGSSFTGCVDEDSTYGWKICKASEDITVDGCSSTDTIDRPNPQRWALWISFSRNIHVRNFEHHNIVGDRGYQSILGWYKDEVKYQIPVTNSDFQITAYGNGMSIINQAGSGNTYDLAYG